jgi:hypothetical protein
MTSSNAGASEHKQTRSPGDTAVVWFIIAVGSFLTIAPVWRFTSEFDLAYAVPKLLFVAAVVCRAAYRVTRLRGSLVARVVVATVFGFPTLLVLISLGLTLIEMSFMWGLDERVAHLKLQFSLFMSLWVISELLGDIRWRWPMTLLDLARIFAVVPFAVFVVGASTWYWNI